jgi:hypothetical protein
MLEPTIGSGGRVCADADFGLGSISKSLTVAPASIYGRATFDL